MIYLILLIFQGSLPLYSVDVDPIYLEQLYSNPFIEQSVPASISFNGEETDCTLSFRGGTSLWCVKKSWHIIVDNPDMFPFGSHLLLNAQYRDASLMRNALGLYITRELGFPAPETQFISLSINGANYGVYDQVERIDRLFYLKNGLGFGPLFKNTDTMGRLAHHFSDTCSIAGLEPKVDSAIYQQQLLELIEACFRNDVSSLATSEFLAAFVVHAAIGDKDGVIKNFYLHYYNELWHYYPWDRDATFGNTWEGVYTEQWETDFNLADIGQFGASRGLLSDPNNRLEFNHLLGQTRSIFENELPVFIDSIRLLIRDDLVSDPYYQYSISQFDSLCAVMINDLSARALFLPEMELEDEIPVIDQLTLSSCLNMESTVKVELTIKSGDPYYAPCLVSFDRQPEVWFNMEQMEEDLWEIEIPVPPETYSVHISVGPYGDNDHMPMFFPGWSIREYDTRPDPTPSARVALAGLYPDLFQPGIPVWCGENLWVLPVTNTASVTQDLSMCRFSLGEPKGNVFLSESILVSPGETIYLTNNSKDAEPIFGGSSIYGDAGTSYPLETTLQLFDPSWNYMHSWQISGSDSLPQNPQSIIPSEISAGNGSDWIELYNNTLFDIDLSQWYLMDSEKNISFLTPGTVLSPMELLLVASNPDMFRQVSCDVINLDFSITNEEDSLSLYSELSNKIFSFAWNSNWPINQEGIMFLDSPLSNLAVRESWNSTLPPGTPGMLNPGWSVTASLTSINLTSQNPNNGAFSFSYRTPSLPAEIIIYDLTGRVQSQIVLTENNTGSVFSDFRDKLPNGIYVLYLRSSGASASTRFTVLN